MPPVTRREILAIALPAAASAVLNNAFRIIDQYAAGSIGTSAQAAVASCTFVLMGCFYFWSMISAGAGPLVARATGAGDEVLRRRAFGNAVVGAVGLYVVTATLLGLGADHVAGLLGLEGAPATDATVFLRTLAIGGLPLALAPTLDATFVALGRTRTMMALQVLAAILNSLLNGVLIHRFGLGVQGAALATCLSRAVASAIGLRLLWRELRLTWAELRPGDELARIVRVGSPVAVNGCFWAGVYWTLLHTTISPLGPTQNAALGIGFGALEGCTYPTFVGLSLGLSSVVGRRLGAGEPGEAVRAVRLAAPLAIGAGLLATAVFRFAAEPLCGLFTHDPEVLAAAVLYAHTLAWSQVCVAVEALSEGALGGSGATRTIFVWSAPVNALRVPLAWVLAFPLGFGAVGVWWAINLTSLVKSVAKGTAAARGRWIHARV